MPVFLSVNGRDVSVEPAVRQALLDPQGRRFVELLVEQELLRQHARSIGLAVSTAELQRAADEMRYERRLKDRERTLEWVRAHEQTPESLEDQIELFLQTDRSQVRGARQGMTSSTSSIWRERNRARRDCFLWLFAATPPRSDSRLVLQLPTDEQSPARLSFLRDAAIDDPTVAIDAIVKEQLSLAQRLPG